ncbi:MAG: cysteine desulfurase family protein [Bacillota bacterium]
MPEAYLDNSATTRVWPEVVETMCRIHSEEYGNPSSLHARGLAAERLVRDARRELAGVVGCSPGEIFFTSGGTEANNWAIFGLSRARQARGNRIVSTAIEHPSVLVPLQLLEEQGFEVILLPVDHRGELEMARLEDALTPGTILVCVMAVNNEIGSVHDLEAISAMVRSLSPHAAIHVDAVQALAKLPLPPPGLVETMSFSAHKLHGPKGTGALYVREGTRLLPLLLGGEQEGKLRAGTENVAGIAGMAQAARLSWERGQDTRRLKLQLAKGLEAIAGFNVNGPAPGGGAPHILNAYFEDVPRGEVLVHALASRGVYVSTGSACHSRRDGPSHVLKAMGMKGPALTGAVRFSLGAATTAGEIELAVDATTLAVDEVKIRRGGRK